MNKHIHVQAHRGASLERRENSLESFQRALEIGADSIELDIHLLQDGMLTVYHDFYVPVSFKEKKFVCELQGKEMQTLGAPTLPEVFEQLKILGSSKLLWLDLEIKYLENNTQSPKREAIADAVLRAVSLHWELSRTRFRSFDWNILKVFQKSVPTFQTIPLVGKEESDLLKALELQPEWIAPHFSVINERVISWFHRSGVKLMPYTVNSLSEWKKLSDWGVDGITTDDPRGLLQFLGK
ncbi:MAG: glycerophosphodiester phosphodiesterase [Pseudomonadota bacterium]